MEGDKGRWREVEGDRGRWWEKVEALARLERGGRILRARWGWDGMHGAPRGPEAPGWALAPGVGELEGPGPLAPLGGLIGCCGYRRQTGLKQAWPPVRVRDAARSRQRGARRRPRAARAGAPVWGAATGGRGRRACGRMGAAARARHTRRGGRPRPRRSGAAAAAVSTAARGPPPVMVRVRARVGVRVRVGARVRVRVRVRSGARTVAHVFGVHM